MPERVFKEKKMTQKNLVCPCSLISQLVHFSWLS